MSPKYARSILAAAIAVLPAISTADPSQDWRCSTDALDRDAALRRLEWARKCGLLTNTAGAGSWFLSTKAFDLASLATPPPVGAKEYQESNTSRAYSGNLNQYNVNFYYATSRYETSPVYTMVQDTTGLTAGFWGWTHTIERPLPLYPSFETTPVAGMGTQLFPHPTLAGCRLYTDTTGTGAYTGSFFMIALCNAACYAPDQRLRFGGGDVNIVAAMQARRDDLVTLSPDATLDRLATLTARGARYTVARDADHVVYRLATASGGTLSVTGDHPIVVASGVLIQASRLHEGDELVRADGTLDPITRIDRVHERGKVYNVEPASRERVANILVAQGYLVGSLRLQGADIDYENRALLFHAIPDDVLPR